MVAIEPILGYLIATSRATGPLISVPLGSFLSSTTTTALSQRQTKATWALDLFLLTDNDGTDEFSPHVRGSLLY